MANRSGLNETGLRGRGARSGKCRPVSGERFCFAFGAIWGGTGFCWRWLYFSAWVPARCLWWVPAWREAINAIAAGAGRINFDLVLNRVVTMAVTYTLSAVMSYGLSRVMIHLSRQVVWQMRRDVFENLAHLPVGFLTGIRQATF